MGAGLPSMEASQPGVIDLAQDHKPGPVHPRVHTNQVGCQRDDRRLPGLFLPGLQAGTRQPETVQRGSALLVSMDGESVVAPAEQSEVDVRIQPPLLFGRSGQFRRDLPPLASGLEQDT